MQSLEIEMKRLQESTKDATERFDERVTTLLEKKVKCTVAIYQVVQHTVTHTHTHTHIWLTPLRALSH